MKIVFEKVIPQAGSSFAILDKRSRRFDGRFHFHPEFEITLIERSSGRRVVGDSIERFAPGDLVLLGQDLPHQYASDPRSDSRAYESVAAAKVIQFRRELLGERWLELPEFRRVSAMLRRADRGLKFSGPTAHAAVKLIGQLFATTEAARLLILLQLLDLLARDTRARPIASAGYVRKINTREGDAIDRALRYLDAHFTEQLTLEDVCKFLGVSPATCNRLFQKSIGQSFKSALINIRISRACRLLLSSDESIVDVAFSSGFTNLSNFNRRFKDLKGITPKAYRNLAPTMA